MNDLHSCEPKSLCSLPHDTVYQYLQYKPVNGSTQLSNRYIQTQCLLQDVVRKRELITYKEVAQHLGIRPQGNNMATEIGAILGAMCVEDCVRGRPFISSLVVRSDTHQPGIGFFNMIRGLGAEFDNDARIQYWQQTLQNLYAYWNLDSEVNEIMRKLLVSN